MAADKKTKTAKAEPVSPIEGIMSSREVGAVLGIHPQTLKLYVRDGRLKPIAKMGRNHVFARADIEAYIA